MGLYHGLTTSVWSDPLSVGGFLQVPRTDSLLCCNLVPKMPVGEENALHLVETRAREERVTTHKELSAR